MQIWKVSNDIMTGLDSNYPPTQLPENSPVLFKQSYWGNCSRR